MDFDEDLQVKDLENAAQEGFDSSELLKRYSTVGMGPSQGKHSNLNALRILARVRGVGVGELGLTTARPMYHPVPLKLLEYTSLGMPCVTVRNVAICHYFSEQDSIFYDPAKPETAAQDTSSYRRLLVTQLMPLIFPILVMIMAAQIEPSKRIHSGTISIMVVTGSTPGSATATAVMIT